jgi:hypothetical protein
METRMTHHFRCGLVQLGFTRVELIVVTGVLVLLGIVVFPALGNSRLRSHLVICANNLRQIGVAQQLWGNDHNDLPPLMVSVNEGGTRAHPLAANAWIHFAWLSNELVTARLVFCPSDVGRPADDFTGSPTSGYLHPNFANRATSYFTSYSSYGGIGDPPSEVMNGDRNVTIDNSSSGCSLLNVAARIERWAPFSPTGQWKTNLHNLQGNAQLRDGRVEMFSSAGLKAALLPFSDDNSSKHIAIPR